MRYREPDGTHERIWMFGFVALLWLLLPAAQAGEAQTGQAEGKKGAGEGQRNITLTIVYDNNPGDKRLTAAWGFSCVVQGLPKTILFDTGARGDVLLQNMHELGIKPADIDVVVLSHIHGDHVRGLRAFLKQNSQVSVFLPEVFPERFKKDVRSTGAQVVETSKGQEICTGAHTTPVLGKWIKEQSLYVETAEGIVVITGCAHPGIVKITRVAKERAGKPVFAVLGGFHMLAAPDEEILRVIRSFKKLGVRKAGPCHCSGKKARKMMKKAFGKDYVSLSVGSRITFLKSKGEKAQE